MLFQQSIGFIAGNTQPLLQLAVRELAIAVELDSQRLSRVIGKVADDVAAQDRLNVVGKLEGQRHADSLARDR